MYGKYLIVPFWYALAAYEATIRCKYCKVAIPDATLISQQFNVDNNNKKVLVFGTLYGDMIVTDHSSTRTLQQAFVRSSLCALGEETVEDRLVFGIHLARRKERSP